MGDGGLEAVLLANQGALLRFLRARGGADAEDLLQELWLKLQGATATGPIAEPLGYLYRIADNLVHDRRRAALRRERRETDWVDHVVGGLTDVSRTPSAERTMLARDELDRMDRALRDMGERTSGILRRFRIDGHSQKAIAAEYGISLSAVEKHLQRAYRGLIAARQGDIAAENEASRRHDPGTISDAVG